MKARAIEVAAAIGDPGERLNRLREYLQAFILRSLHESEAFQRLSFVGGTALRFMYGLPRFSEDLDFSLENSQGYAPQKWLSKLRRDLTFAGFDPTITWNDRKTVHIGWVRVAGLLKEVGLAGTSGQKLSVKLEIDTLPPSGAATENRAVNRHFLMAFRHHDLPSLMAGKVHALCARKYPKGRDWYDLLWYRAQVPPASPNLRLLQAALDQTEGAQRWPAEQWREVLRRRLKALDAEALRDDVAPFLERSADRELLTKEHLVKAISED